ncbi:MULTISPECIES: thioredoxin family protein [Halorussus]|uniref:thioredoxin family protein n=1 Tax=Halorussus TaxID=1070314 RepID=UPI00209E75C0|nr:thioredoxin family protein [Halorussus vallis]USZ77946.1 thioredoxin family protein [Halorussus vallis]
MAQLIQFSTPSCGQCPQQEEILRAFASERTDVEFQKVDATTSPEEANKYGVRSVPSTIVLGDDERVLAKFDGLTQSSEIEQAL